MGPQADKQLPPSPVTGQFLRKADIKDWSLLVIWFMDGTRLARPSLLRNTLGETIADNGGKDQILILCMCY
jgi:hypothetical protein